MQVISKTIKILNCIWLNWNDSDSYSYSHIHLTSTYKNIFYTIKLFCCDQFIQNWLPSLAGPKRCILTLECKKKHTNPSQYFLQSWMFKVTTRLILMLFYVFYHEKILFDEICYDIVFIVNKFISNKAGLNTWAYTQK